MERLFRLTAALACVGEQHDLPEGTLVIEPRSVARDSSGGDFVFLASPDGGQTWREYVTVIESFDDWFELVAPGQAPVRKQ